MSKRSEILAQIAALRDQQRESSLDATYLGWTPGTSSAHDGRADLIAFLMARLADSSGD